MRKSSTLILIAAEDRARAFENHGRGAGLIPVEDLQPGNPPAGYADRPTRVHESGSPTRHGAEPPTSERALRRHRFAAELAAWLAARTGQARFEKMVIAAGPAMLGELRKAMEDTHWPETVEIAKDLINIPDPDLPEHFSDYLRL